jgi:hypothetical protein
MSLPKELRDQLLSGYLDETLSSDERARVEQLLQSEPEMSEELAQLHNLRLSLKALAVVDSDIKLDEGFADRVLGAAVARARSEGYGDDHPLVRLSGHPSTPARPAPGASSWRYAGVLVALAASIVIAVVTLRPEQAQDPGVALLPDTGPSVAVVPETEVTPERDPLVVPDRIAESAKIADADSEIPIAPAADDLQAQPASPESAMERLESPPRTSDSIARSETPRLKDSVEPPAKSTMDLPEMNQGAILVLDVRRTAAGRRSRAVADAMEFAELGAASEKEITDEIVGLANEAQPSAEGEYSLFYLQAPAKNLDRFYLRLLDDKEGIESVGMTLALEAPIMKMVRTLQSDPTLIRHDAPVLLTSEDGSVDDLTSRLGQLPFGPFDRGAISALPSKGPDITAQILVLVR